VVGLAACGSVSEPVFQIELWPEEGIPAFEATGEPLRLHETPNRAALVTYVVETTAGTPIEFDGTRYQTWEPGTIEVLEAAVIGGRDMGAVQHLTRDQYYSLDFPHEEWRVVPGDTIEYLQYRAEGTCFVRIEGVVVNADLCPAFLQDAFLVATEPVTEWWIHATIGERTGWLLVDQTVLRRRSLVTVLSAESGIPTAPNCEGFRLRGS
jgi:hypothetical protein